MKLLLVAPSTRAMVESAKKAGYDFLSLDFFGDADQKALCENYSLNHELKDELSIENLFKRSRQLAFTHVVYGSGFENHPELVAELEKDFNVLGNSAKTLKKVRDWRRFFRTLKKAGIHHPETQVMPKNEAEEALKTGENLIIKPVKSGGGHSIYDKCSLDGIEDKALEGEVLVQECVEGFPASATLIGTGRDSLFIGAAHQLVGTSFNKYKYVGNTAPLGEDKSTLEEVMEVSGKIARAFRLKGCNGIDFILKGGEPYITEVNPRITGSMEVLERAYRINLLDLHVKACLGKLEGRELKMREPKGFFGKKILFAKNSVFYRIRRRPGYIKDVPRFNEFIEEKNPICTVLGLGDTPERCIADLNNKEREIRKMVGER